MGGDIVGYCGVMNEEVMEDIIADMFPKAGLTIKKCFIDDLFDVPFILISRKCLENFTFFYSLEDCELFCEMLLKMAKEHFKDVSNETA
jgi:hypothetical protein